LLEAKKRFDCIVDGKPVITDALLGQAVAEALAWRLSSESSNGVNSKSVLLPSDVFFLFFFFSFLPS